MSTELIAYLADRRAGRLIRKDNGNLQFRYDGATPKEIPRLWEALVFNSLLYDTGAPMLAPLYDLVSTTAYPELTTRLAMRIGGATMIEEVDGDAWFRLAADVGVSERFARRTSAAVVERVSAALTAHRALEQPLAGGIARRILAFRG